MAYYRNIVEQVTGGATVQIHKAKLTNKIGQILSTESSYLSIVQLADETIGSTGANATILKTSDNIFKLSFYNATASQQAVTCIIEYMNAPGQLQNINFSFYLISANPFTTEIRLRSINTIGGCVLLDNTSPFFSHIICKDFLRNEFFNCIFLGGLQNSLLCSISDGLNRAYTMKPLVTGHNVEGEYIIKFNAGLIITGEGVKYLTQNMIATMDAIPQRGIVQIGSEIYYHTGNVGYLIEDR